MKGSLNEFIRSFFENSRRSTYPAYSAAWQEPDTLPSSSGDPTLCARFPFQEIARSAVANQNLALVAESDLFDDTNVHPRTSTSGSNALGLWDM